MNDKPYSISPAWFGLGAMIAAALASGSVWLIFAQGPDGIGQDRLFVALALGFLPLVAGGSGLVAVAMGLRHRLWLASVTGAIALAMMAYEAWFLSWFLFSN